MSERDTQDYYPLLLHVSELHTPLVSQEVFLKSSQEQSQKLFCWYVGNSDALIPHGS